MKIKFSLSLFTVCILIMGALAGQAAGQAPLKPQWQVTVKDARILSQLLQRNEWFQQFRQTPLYAGSMQRLSPVLFSMADEYGPSAQGWKGRLLDYAYDQILQGQPLRIAYFNRSQLISPLVLTVLDLSKTQIKATEGLLKVFRSAEDQEIEPGESLKVKVSPLLIRGQKFAAALQGKCLTVSRDPKLVAIASQECSRISKPSMDGVFTVFLSQQFPALNGVRDRFLGVEDQVSVDLKWNSSKYRLEPAAAQARLGATHTFLKAPMPATALSALPSTTFFATTVSVPSLQNFTRDQVMGYFKENKKTLVQRRPTSVTLFYAPYLETFEEQEGDKTRTWSALRLGTGLLLHSPKANEQTMQHLSELMMGQRAGEVFMRPVCKDHIFLSNKKGLVKLVDEVCAKKRSSVAEISNSPLRLLTQKDVSAAVYFSPGKLLSRFIQLGWDRQYEGKKAVEAPAELKTSQKLVEELSDYMLSGQATADKLVLK